MAAEAPVNSKTVAAFLLGLLALACGLLVLFGAPDFLLLGVPLFWGLAVPVGLLGRREVRQSQGRLKGKALAAWGMGLPAAGACLGFLLLPFV